MQKIFFMRKQLKILAEKNKIYFIERQINFIWNLNLISDKITTERKAGHHNSQKTE